MTDYYVDYATGNDTTGNGTSGTPWKTIKKATDTVTAGDHRIFVSDDAADTPGAGTTYTVAAGVRLFSTTGINTTYSSRGATISNTGAIIIEGGQWNGFVFSTSSNTGGSLTLGPGDYYTELRDCTLAHATGAGATANIVFGAGGGGDTNVIRLIDCDYTTVSTGSDWSLQSSRLEWIGGSICATGTALTNLFAGAGSRGTFYCRFEGVDLSTISGNIAVGAAATAGRYEFVNCKIHASTTIASSYADGVEVILRDCASGNTHYNFAHYDKYGSTVATTSQYAANGAKYDGTDGVGWIVSTTSSASKARPYRTPWISVYHSGTSAITPYLEAMRTSTSAGAGTAYTDAEVWAEWLAKTTDNVSDVAFSTDRAAYTDDTGTAQTASSLTDADWTGDSTYESFFKLGGSFTPYEIGHISARVCVGLASVADLYVDPFVRGLS